jgi:hypothetical protein
LTIPKAYQPAATEVAISIPQRRYDALGDVLAQAIVTDGPASTARLAAHQLARERAQALGERVRAQRQLGRLGPERALTVVSELLAACGYAPARARPSSSSCCGTGPSSSWLAAPPSWSVGSTRSSWPACWRGCAAVGSTPSSNPTRRPTRPAAAYSYRRRPTNPSAPHGRTRLTEASQAARLCSKLRPSGVSQEAGNSRKERNNV